ncbi:MAG: phage portal protein [Lachnospiraceae bacterium]|nr:phage portal protein [Lachnospiraceae bacterium]
MEQFVYPLDDWNESDIDINKIRLLIDKHEKFARKLRKNKAYYDGKHAILEKQRTTGAPNAKIVCNHAKDISDTASGYFMGNAITYKSTGDSDIEPLIKVFKKAHVDDTDSELALELSISGIAYEYLYMKDGNICSKALNPIHTFIVIDDTIEENILFGVYYWKKKNDVTGTYTWKVTVATEHLIYTMSFQVNNEDVEKVKGKDSPQKHNFEGVPILEYKNNKFGMGDFEQQIPLIDAYNTLMSDRINDKEQFIDALLVLYGASLADDEEEAREAAKVLRENKMLELPEGSRAEYLLRTYDENGVETLRKALKEDIYTFSHVPNLTDENFAGNSSGVAMEYKLLGLEMLTRIKTRYYKKSLRKRIYLFCNVLKLKNILIEVDEISADFPRTLPKNLLELSQVIANLREEVSAQTLIRLLPFVESPDKELEDVEKQKERKRKEKLEKYGMQPNSMIEDLTDEEE